MEKIFNLSLILLICATSLQAQFTDGFENWYKNATVGPYTWEYPEGWSTSNPVTEFLTFSVTKSEEAYTGVYAVKLQSSNIFGNDRPGVLMLGNAFYQYNTLSMSAEDGYDLDLIPNKVRGWYKLVSEDPNAHGLLEIKVLRYNENSQADSVLLSHQYELAPADEYTPFEFLISYFISIDPDHDKLSLAFYSNRPGDITHPVSMWIDDVALDLISSANTVYSGTQQLLILPNPGMANKEVKLIFSQPLLAPDMVSVYDQAGKLISRFQVTPAEVQYHLPTLNWPPGTYYIHVEGLAKSTSLVLH